MVAKNICYNFLEPELITYKGGDNIKKYSDFLATLNEETFIEIANKVNQSELKISFSNAEETLNNLATSFGTMNILISLEVIKLYHEWLHE